MKFKVSFFGPGRATEHVYPKTFDAAVEQAEAKMAEEQETDKGIPKMSRARLYVHDEITDHVINIQFWSQYQLVGEFHEGQWNPSPLSHALERLRAEAKAREDFATSITSIQMSLIARRHG